MDVSYFLAQTLGVYLVILSLSLLNNPDNFISVISGIFHNAALQFLIGMNILIIGILMVVSHNVWTASWAVVVTILSWLIFIKGLLYIAFPKVIHAMSQPFLGSKNLMYAGAMVNLVLGLWLCYMGFMI